MKTFRLTFLFYTLLIAPWSSTKGEYRAFLLEIKSPDTETPRLVRSSLDHLQYHYYYPVRANESVRYIETWRCPGRTSGLAPVCKSPKEIAAEKTEAPGADSAPLQTPEQTPAQAPTKGPERSPASK